MDEPSFVDEKIGAFRHWLGEFCYWYGWLMRGKAAPGDRSLQGQTPNPKRLEFYWHISYGCVNLRIINQERVPDLTGVVIHGQAMNDLRVFTRSEWHGRELWYADNHLEQVLQIAAEIETHLAQALPGITQSSAIRVCALFDAQTDNAAWGRPMVCETLIDGQWRCGRCDRCRNSHAETVPD